MGCSGGEDSRRQDHADKVNVDQVVDVDRVVGWLAHTPGTCGWEVLDGGRWREVGWEVGMEVVYGREVLEGEFGVEVGMG
jgi:hypothetical protein